jgi:hypothetical protein
MTLEELRQDALDGTRRDRVAAVHCERHSGELIDHGEHLHGAARGDGVIDDVVGPDVVAVGGGHRHTGAAPDLAPASSRSHRQAVLAPDALDALAVHLVAAAAQLPMGAAHALAWLAATDLADRGEELSVILASRLVGQVRA